MSSLEIFQIAASGLNVGNQQMLAISNDVANAQTHGYKSVRVDQESAFPLYFDEALSEYQAGGDTAGSLEEHKAEFGSGVRVAGTTRNFKQGTIDVTNRELDLAIEGRGFFTIRTPDGQLRLTRNGVFSKSIDGTLVNTSGYQLDPPVRIPDNTTALSIDKNGRVIVQINNQLDQSEIGQIQLATVPNEEGLVEIGQNSFITTPASGEAKFETPGQEGTGVINQFALEFSNVDLISSMTKMVIQQRTFEVQTKIIQTAERMLSNAVEIARS